MSEAVVSVQASTLCGPKLAPYCCSTFHLKIDHDGVPEDLIPQEEFDALAESINERVDDTYYEPLGIICAAGGLCAACLVGLPCMHFAKQRAQKKCEIIEEGLQKQIAVWEKTGVEVAFKDKSSKSMMENMDYSLRVSLVPTSAPVQESMAEPDTPKASPVRKRGLKDKFSAYMPKLPLKEAAEPSAPKGPLKYASPRYWKKPSVDSESSNRPKVSDSFNLDNLMDKGGFE
mmetsp:Transcript_81583/g.141757  ORF Transcript_81583/g.141757 Transcript_81583/m.141757 type:complete len:231 (-) Transcript_81583:226-918(-)